MHPGKKTADLRSRREGPFLSLENRSTAVVSWSRLRAKQPAFVQRRRPGEKAPLLQLARRLRGQRQPNEFLEVPTFWDFPLALRGFAPACNITVIYYQKVLLY